MVYDNSTIGGEWARAALLEKSLIGLEALSYDTEKCLVR
jgi:hypothetical protein